jgi:hypothetical protein
MEYNNQQICVKSRNRTLACRIELLNTSYNVLDYIQGKVINGSITLTNNNNDQSNFSRLSGTLEMIISKDLTTKYYKLDLRNLVRVIMIITDNVLKISSEFNLGIALLNSPTVTRGVNGVGKISINLNDLMCNFDGTFNGELDHSVKIESSLISGANISQTLRNIATNLDLMNLSSDKVMFESNSFTIPHDITCEAGNKITDLLKSLMELQMDYELFFNPDGILIYQKRKTHDSDIPIQDFINDSVVTNYVTKDDSTNAKNVIVVLGSVQESADSTSVPYQYKATSKIDDYNPNHPLSIKNFGIHKKVITNDKALSNEQCKSQADYNLDKYSNYAEQIELTMLPDYRLIPNRVIVLEYSDDNLTIELGRYLINSVTFGLKPSDLATVSVSKIYSNITT